MNNEIFELQTELPLAGKGLSYSKKEWKRIYGYEIGLVAGAKFVKKENEVKRTQGEWFYKCNSPKRNGNNSISTKSK